EQMGAQVGQLSSAGCEVVFLTAVPSTAGAILGASAQGGFAPQWIGQSPTWVNALAASPIAEYLAANFHLVAEGPEWGDTSVPGMAQMMEDVEEFAPEQGPDIYFAFGYGASWAVHQVLEAAVENGDLSREGIVEAMNGIDALQFDGLFGEYPYGPPEERVPPRVSRIFEVVPGEENPLRAISEEFSSEAAEAFEFE
ncbi:MAG TPA: ABC transporter substrate-binding protein, partial [Acidimicrobiia bacterium]|nr:ABC transporter substrate-binding protein [Acidimicrobiia bacterium]